MDQRIINIMICVIILAMSVPSVICAQQPDRCNNKFNGDYILSYAPATWFTIKQPIKYKAKDWAVASGLVAATAVVYVFDEEIYNFFDNQFTEENAVQFGKIADGYGSGLLSIPMLEGFYITGIIQKNDRARHAALVGLQAFFLSGGAGWVMKELTQRVRPDQLTNPDPGVWAGPFSGTGYNSFPSGHTMRAFALATVLTGIYNDKPWVGVGMFAMAGLTAYSRLVSGEHWPSDVIAGAALGYGIGRAVLLFNRNKQLQCIEPSVGKYGIGMVYKINKRRIN